MIRFVAKQRCLKTDQRLAIPRKDSGPRSARKIAS